MLDIHDSESVVTVGLPDKFLGCLHGRVFEKRINHLLVQGRRAIDVDLDKTTLLDSTGIGVLIRTAKTIRKMGGSVCLLHLNDRVRNLFLMTRLLGPVFEAFDTKEEARIYHQQHHTAIAG